MEYNILTIARDRYGVLGRLVAVDKVCVPEDCDEDRYVGFDQELEVMGRRVIQDGIYMGQVEDRLYVLDLKSDRVFYVTTKNNDIKNAVWCEDMPAEIRETANILSALKDGLTYNDVACALGLL